MITHFEQRIRHVHGRQVHDKQVYHNRLMTNSFMDDWIAGSLQYYHLSNTVKRYPARPANSTYLPKFRIITGQSTIIAVNVRWVLNSATRSGR
jgi:hypothetical protein